ncbi:MAG: alginate lyase family protein [Nitrospira sp.]|nr:alginate lyase family protein [Nitrospira sp.]
MATAIHPDAPMQSDSHFSFLGRSQQFESGKLGWAGKDMPKLWRYNLHYFDYLQHPQRSIANKSHLISDWIAHNPQGTVDAWEPYTASLRIVNWVKFFLSLSTTSLDRNHLEEGGTKGEFPAGLNPEWLRSLYQQALWLEQNIEYHILANHYLKNSVALFFAGAYFQGVDADRWLKKGVQILREELDEQFLADGGHFERSPMYHSICVTDYLDVLNLARNSQGVLSPEDQARFAERMTSSLDFLSDMCLPDKEIALFNDSAFGIAPTPKHIFDYAKKVIGYEPPVRHSGLTIHSHAASGYFVCHNDQDAIIIDGGSIGPDYQPGHAHCDTLSFELAIEGRRVIVDSGVHDYEPSRERAYARSTKAHNTVVVDGGEQSEIWGVFRVARRARPLDARIERRPDGSVWFTGAHDGYTRLKGRPIHTRSIAYDGKETWIIEDRLEGSGAHRMESYLHIHPDYHVEKNGASFHITEANGKTIAMIEPAEANPVKIERGSYFPEFGRKYENDVMVFCCAGVAPLRLSYRIAKKTALNQ